MNTCQNIILPANNESCDVRHNVVESLMIYETDFNEHYPGFSFRRLLDEIKYDTTTSISLSPIEVENGEVLMSKYNYLCTIESKRYKPFYFGVRAGK